MCINVTPYLYPVIHKNVYQNARHKQTTNLHNKAMKNDKIKYNNFM